MTRIRNFFFIFFSFFRLLIVATTSIAHLLEDLQLTQVGKITYLYAVFCVTLRSCLTFLCLDLLSPLSFLYRSCSILPAQAFNITLHVSMLQNSAEYAAVLRDYAAGLGEETIQNISLALKDKAIAIKQFLVILEMVRSEKSDSEITAEDFMSTLETVGF